MHPHEYRLKAPQWDAKLSPFWIGLLRPLRRYLRRRRCKLPEVTVRGAERLRQLLAQEACLLITPNHASYDDPVVMYEAADAVGRPFAFMTAWQVFARSGWVLRWLLQRHGCFSVEREGTDLRAFKQALRFLSEGAYPLVIFPEGLVYHVNDRVTPFREGPAVIALACVRQTSKPLYAAPCAIKYRYLQDPTPQLEGVMTELERRFLWRPQTQRPLADRIYKFAEAALALKETEYMDTRQQGSLPERIRGLREHLLSGLERSYGAKADTQTVPERVKNVRRACLERLEQVRDDPGAAAEVGRQLEDVSFAVQLFSYPGDYVRERPTIERLAETMGKFEEDVLGLPYARVHGPRRAVVEFGEPIDLRRFAEGAAQPRKLAGQLTNTLEQAVQSLLDTLNHA